VGAEGGEIGFQQGSEAAEFPEQLAGEVDRAFAGHAGTQEDRQQFGVGEGLGALFQQFLPGPFLGRPILDAHGRSLSGEAPASCRRCAILTGSFAGARRPRFAA